MKRAASTVSAIGLYSGNLFWQGCANGDHDDALYPAGYPFSLAKGPLMNNGATPWYTTIFLGTPRQIMTVMMDTGTANTWVTSAWCDTPACATKIYKYDAALSTTHEPVSGATWQQNQLGSWGEFTSLAGKDYFVFSDPEQGETRLQMKFLSAILQDVPGVSNWHDLDMCGGVGFPVRFDNPDAVNNPQSLLPRMLAQRLISGKLVSFWMDADRGACIVGGTNPSRFDPQTRNELALTASTRHFNLWTVALDQMFRNEAPLLSQPIDLALDTGSSRFKGSPEIIAYLIDQITTSPDGHKLPTTFSDPARLAEFPDLTLQINGHAYTLQPQDYIWKLNDSDQYSLQFHPLDLEAPNTILVGSVFLDHVYSVFEYADDPIESCGLSGKRVILYRRR